MPNRIERASSLANQRGGEERIEIRKKKISKKCLFTCSYECGCVAIARRLLWHPEACDSNPESSASGALRSPLVATDAQCVPHTDTQIERFSFTVYVIRCTMASRKEINWNLVLMPHSPFAECHLLARRKRP